MNIKKRYRWMVLDHKGRLIDPPIHDLNGEAGSFTTEAEAEGALGRFKSHLFPSDEMVLITVYLKTWI